MKYLLNNPDNQLYFINILDGNTSYSQKNKFTYLLSLPEYAVVSNKIFVDDMFHFQDWYNSLLVN
jgi:nitrous oxide reductase accessory protein NosL